VAGNVLRTSDGDRVRDIIQSYFEADMGIYQVILYSYPLSIE